jgi:hypothetical protein
VESQSFESLLGKTCNILFSHIVSPSCALPSTVVVHCYRDEFFGNGFYHYLLIHLMSCTYYVGVYNFAFLSLHF